MKIVKMKRKLEKLIELGHGELDVNVSEWMFPFGQPKTLQQAKSDPRVKDYFRCTNAEDKPVWDFFLKDGFGFDGGGVMGEARRTSRCETVRELLDDFSTIGVCKPRTGGDISSPSCQ